MDAMRRRSRAKGKSGGQAPPAVVVEPDGDVAAGGDGGRRALDGHSAVEDPKDWSKRRSLRSARSSGSRSGRSLLAALQELDAEEGGSAGRSPGRPASTRSSASRPSLATYEDVFDVDDGGQEESILNPDGDVQIDADSDDYETYDVPRPGSAAKGRGARRGKASKVKRLSARLGKLVGGKASKSPPDRASRPSLTSYEDMYAADDAAKEECIVNPDASVRSAGVDSDPDSDVQRSASTGRGARRGASKRLSARITSIIRAGSASGSSKASSTGSGEAATEAKADKRSSKRLSFRRSVPPEKQAARAAKVRAKQEAAEEKRRVRQLKKNPWYPAGVDFRFLSPKSLWVPYLGRKGADAEVDFGHEARLVGSAA